MEVKHPNTKFSFADLFWRFRCHSFQCYEVRSILFIGIAYQCHLIEFPCLSRNAFLKCLLFMQHYYQYLILAHSSGGLLGKGLCRTKILLLELKVLSHLACDWPLFMADYPFLITVKAWTTKRWLNKLENVILLKGLHFTLSLRSIFFLGYCELILCLWL